MVFSFPLHGHLLALHDPPQMAIPGCPPRLFPQAPFSPLEGNGVPATFYGLAVLQVLEKFRQFGGLLANPLLGQDMNRVFFFLSNVFSL